MAPLTRSRKGVSRKPARTTKNKKPLAVSGRDHALELVIISGMSGAGKLSALKTFEDLGYYSVDNLPVGLIASFAELVRENQEIDKAALVVDIREGEGLEQFPSVLRSLRQQMKTSLLFLEAGDEALIRRFYAGRLTTLDRFRLLSGRPPVPVAAGLRAFFTRAAHG